MKIVHCHFCRRKLCNDEIAINIKVFGKQVGFIRCYKCLSEFIGCKICKLKEMAEFYKITGCIVFKTKYTSVKDMSEPLKHAQE